MNVIKRFFFFINPACNYCLLIRIESIDKRLKGKIALIGDVSGIRIYENTRLTNITIEFLPLNNTAHLQPCNQGIINSFKVSIIVFHLLKIKSLI